MEEGGKFCSEYKRETSVVNFNVPSHDYRSIISIFLTSIERVYNLRNGWKKYIFFSF